MPRNVRRNDSFKRCSRFAMRTWWHGGVGSMANWERINKTMNTINIIKRITMVAAVALSLGVSLAPRADASVSGNSVHSASVSDPSFGGGGKDGNESHG